MIVNLGQLIDRTFVTPSLIDKHMSSVEAARKADLIGAAAAHLLNHGGRNHSPAHWCFVPGRIEVLGKHTDYAGGRSLICAAERGFCAVGIEREDAALRMSDVARHDTAAFPLHADLVPNGSDWTNYPMTVARRIARNFPAARRGLDIAFASDLPSASGMSSSSALVIMTFLLLDRANHLADCAAYRDNIDGLAAVGGYLGTIENGQTFGTLPGDQGVGTFGGSEDHTAILCSEPGRIAQFAYCPVRRERWLDLAPEHVFAIGVSGVSAEKTGAAMAQYNRAARRASAIAEMWRQQLGRSEPHLAAILATGQDAAQRVRELLESHRHAEFTASELADRFDQFMAENEEIIPCVPNRLVGAHLELFGELAHRSQMLGARQLGNQVAQTEWLAETAERLGAAAASAFGAGFGGSVWALIHANQADSFLADWRARYAQAYPHEAERATFFATRPGPAAIA